MVSAMCITREPHALFRHLNFQKWSEKGVFCTFWLGNMLRTTTACTFSTSQLPNVVWDGQFLTLLTSKCASRQNGVHFGKFKHLNFQNCSEAEVSCKFWLGNVLRGTTACAFSTSQLPKQLPQWCAFHVLTSKCSSRHDGVQLLRARRFSEPTFRSSWATKQRKNTVLRDFSTFSRACILISSDSFSSLIFFLLPFSSPTLVTCPFPSVHIVRSLTSKLPSMNRKQYTHTQTSAYTYTCLFLHAHVTYTILYINNEKIYVYICIDM